MPDHSISADRSLVSAVIPTRGRPELLARAIRSALRQTWQPLEVLVVVDGPDPATAARLEDLADPRLRTVFLPAASGGSAARNAGVRAARGEWIGFLDDDDEWLPEKIERQMLAIGEMPDWFPVVSCRLIARSPSISRVLPPRCYDPRQPLAEYLFCRTGLTDPGGLMQTSTLLASRELLLAIPFEEDLTIHQDWDWLIRAASHAGVGIRMIPQPLSIWRVEDGRPTVSRAADWKASFAWAQHIRSLISPRAFSWFVAIECGWRAQKSRAGLRARLLLLWSFLFEGSPEPDSFLHGLGYGLVPARLRRSLRNRIWRKAGAADPATGLRLVFARKSTPVFLRKSSL